jgi:hypothetical protein
MDELRRPVFVAALVLALLVVLVETGSRFFTVGATPSAEQMAQQLRQLEDDDVAVKFKEAVPVPASGRFERATPPGVAIRNMAVLDGLLLYSMGLLGLPFVLTDRVVGRLQGIGSLLVALLALITALLGILAAFGQTLLMVGLFTATPFGTLAYMVGWGFFDRGGAALVLSLLLVLKFGFAACLVLAHPRFLQNKGLVLMILCSLLANVIISFLHNLVPVFLVSITDMIAGIVVLVLACIWAILMLISAISAVLKAIF